jgi:hypothetical protein
LDTLSLHDALPILNILVPKHLNAVHVQYSRKWGMKLNVCNISTRNKKLN